MAHKHCGIANNSMTDKRPGSRSGKRWFLIVALMMASSEWLTVAEKPLIFVSNSYAFGGKRHFSLATVRSMEME
jgi:hypothetical protein